MALHHARELRRCRGARPPSDRPANRLWAGQCHPVGGARFRFLRCVQRRPRRDGPRIAGRGAQGGRTRATTRTFCWPGRSTFFWACSKDLTDRLNRGGAEPQTPWRAPPSGNSRPFWSTRRGGQTDRAAMRASPRHPQTYLFQAWPGLCHSFEGGLTKPSSGPNVLRGRSRHVEPRVNMAAALPKPGGQKKPGEQSARRASSGPRPSLAIFRRAYADAHMAEVH